MTIYIYALLCPKSGDIRYIGKSIDPRRRLAKHLQDAKTPKNYNQRWIASLVREGLEPGLLVLKELSEGEDWQQVERAAIAAGFANGLKLTNTSAGGEGVLFVNPEMEAKRIARVKEAWQRQDLKDAASRRAVERCRTEGARADMSARSKSIWSEQAYADLVSRRISEHYSTPEARIAQAERSKAAHRDPVVKEKRCASLKKAWLDQESKAARVLAMKAAQNTPKAKAQKSQEMKIRHQDPVFKAKVMAAMSDPEMIKRRGAAISAAKQRKKALQLLGQSLSPEA